MNKYKMTVGLEVHAELKTNTKIFCSCQNSFGQKPNSLVCPICMGLPGALPSLNREAVILAVRAGLACGCEIERNTKLDRKNYFYPDLPKAFQISQYDKPLCHGGKIEIEDNGKKKYIGITRIHIEEDAGKLLHGENGETLIDYNRCGVPLIEIVSMPCIHSSSEAKSYLKELRNILLSLGVSDCKMNEGSMRCDVNISVAPEESTEMGQKVEIKNINSFAFAAKAIDHEFSRQCALLDSGEQILPQTRRYNEATGKTDLMRTKESAEDYRFFPEPDLLPLHLGEDEINRSLRSLPELPSARKERYKKELLLSDYDANIICSDPELSALFEKAAQGTKYKKLLANLLLGEALRLCKSDGFHSPMKAEYFSELCELWGEEKITSSCAKKLLCRLWEDAEQKRLLKHPAQIAEDEGLWQINSEDELKALAQKAIEKSPKAVLDFKAGKERAFGTIKGALMSESGGKANPQKAEEILRRLLNEI